MAEVAAAVGVTDVAVYRWEVGERRPSGRPAVLWAELLDELTRAQAVSR
jgi:DNA-binding transcriptional regulator YiaG